MHALRTSTCRAMRVSAGVVDASDRRRSRSSAVLAAVVQLNSGHAIPTLGFGCGTAWFKRGDDVAAFNPDLVASVAAALRQGFRHLDLAEMYGTDREVGAALQQAGLQRGELFVTSKLLKSLAEAETATQRLVDTLGIGYLDLLLVHAPFLPAGVQLEQAWGALEALVDRGLVRSIGVSNFRVEDLKQLLSFARIKPAVNQVEFHPYLQQPELHALCRENGIVVSGYTGLVSLTHKTGGPVDEVVEDIARATGLSPTQVLVSWGLQKGVVVITTSSRPERMAECLSVAGTRSEQPLLTAEQIQRIDDAGSKLDFRRFWQKEFGFVEAGAAEKKGSL